MEVFIENHKKSQCLHNVQKPLKKKTVKISEKEPKRAGQYFFFNILRKVVGQIGERRIPTMPPPLYNARSESWIY